MLHIEDEEFDEEDDFEIGTTVVIGRTHVFSGEARSYSGMPASSMAEEEYGGFRTMGSDSFLSNSLDAHLKKQQMDGLL